MLVHVGKQPPPHFVMNKEKSQQKYVEESINELHNFLTLLSTIFIVVHVLAVWVDPFTRFGWNEIFIPFVSTYRTVWMALGIIALYLGIAIGLSTLLRRYIGYKWWRRLHVLTLGIYVIATIHGLGTGSDTQTWWGLGIYIASMALVGPLLLRRIFAPKNKKKHAPAAASPPRPAQGITTPYPGNPRALNSTNAHPGGIPAASIPQRRQAEVARVR